MSTVALVLIFVLLLLLLTGVVGFALELLGWVALIALGVVILRRKGPIAWDRARVPLSDWIGRAMPVRRRAAEGGTRQRSAREDRRGRYRVGPPG